MDYPTDQLGNSARGRRIGTEIFEIHPIVLGGSATDPKNKIFLTRREHVEAVRYWNKKLRALRREISGEELAEGE